MGETWKARVRTAVVVEDDLTLLAALVRALHHEAQAVTVGASSIAQARELLQTVQPDACIVDNQLPDGCGVELIHEIRANNPRARIILMTGHGSMEVGADAIRAGADQVIAKPATLAEIMERLYGEAEPDGTETPSADRVRWEHMHRVLSECAGNKSLAARRLGVDRGTLQRWLSRKGPQY
jgi:two-component system response regulator RegA